MKNFFASAIVFILFAQFTFSQNEFSPKVQIWQVDAETAPCNGIKGGECLLIKQTGKKTFEIFDEKIDGFNYENGFSYAISVKMQLKEPPIAVGESMYKYVLVNVISKKGIATNSTYPTSTSTTSSVRTIEVNYESVSCEEDNSKTCLLIREKGKKEFEILNKRIDGFDFQPGYSYVINIVEDKSGNYFLIKELSKKFIQSSTAKYNPIDNSTEPKTYKNTNGKIIGESNIQTSSPLDGKWYLRKMKETEGSSFVTDDNIMWIDIKTFTDRIDGFGACNNFSTVVKSDLKTTFEISKLTSNLSFCGNKKIENLFYDLLQQSNKFEIRNGNLFLSKQWNNLLIFTSNPNNKEEIKEKYTKPAIVKSENSTYATNEDLAAKNSEDYNYQSSSTTKTETTTKTESNTNTTDVDEMQQKIDEMQKALEAKKQAAINDARIVEQEKLAEQKAAEQAAKIAASKAEELRKKEEDAKQKADAEKIAAKAAMQKKLDDLQKEMDELDNPKSATITKSSSTKYIETTKPTNTKNTNPVETEVAKSTNTTIQKSAKTETNSQKTTNENSKTKDEEIVTKQETSDYAITPFKQNKSNNFEDPEFSLRPYYLDGPELKRLERTEGIFVTKQKGIYRGTDRFVNAMKQESEVQFKKGSIPRFFIKLENEKMDPYDIINLCVADVKRDRRTFLYRSQRLSGKVKDVTDNFIDLEFKKIREGLYEIIIDEELPVGEYGFLPIATESQNASYVNSVKVNCFGVAP